MGLTSSARVAFPTLPPPAPTPLSPTPAPLATSPPRPGQAEPVIVDRYLRKRRVTVHGDGRDPARPGAAVRVWL